MAVNTSVGEPRRQCKAGARQGYSSMREWAKANVERDFNCFALSIVAPKTCGHRVAKKWAMQGIREH